MTLVGGGAGEGYVNVGTRPAPPLVTWPYTQLQVDEIVPAGDPTESSDSVIPTQIATGWHIP